MLLRDDKLLAVLMETLVLEGVKEKIVFLNKTRSPDKQLGDDVINLILKVDPSGQYTTTLVKWLDTDGSLISKNGESLVKSVLDSFSREKNKKIFQDQKDINHYKSFDELKQVVSKYIRIEGDTAQPTASTSADKPVNPRLGGKYPPFRDSSNAPQFKSVIQHLTSFGDCDIWKIDATEEGKKSIAYEMVKTLCSQYGDIAWCIKVQSTFMDYAEQGPFYYISIQGKPYALIHPATQQFKDVNDREFPDTDEELDEEGSMYGFYRAIASVLSSEESRRIIQVFMPPLDVRKFYGWCLENHISLSKAYNFYNEIVNEARIEEVSPIVLDMLEDAYWGAKGSISEEFTFLFIVMVNLDKEFERAYQLMKDDRGQKSHILLRFRQYPSTCTYYGRLLIERMIKSDDVGREEIAKLHHLGAIDKYQYADFDKQLKAMGL